MKQFTCNCIEDQFKHPDKVYVGIDNKYIATTLCAYKPKEKVALRNIKLELNYCPKCGSKLIEI